MGYNVTTPYMKISVKRKIDKKMNDEDIIQALLEDRGISDSESFLNPPHPFETSFQHFFNDKETFNVSIKKTIDLLKKIKRRDGTIVVYSDYDADGVTGGAIMWETFHKMGFKVMPYIPDRKKEGYGFSIDGIDQVIAQFNPELIISVDHGISAHEKISYAATKKIPIIITDHHQKREVDSEDAFAIFHTDKLSGSSVSYFFSKEIAEKFSSEHSSIREGFKTDYLALAAIGTIADLIPLTDDARNVAFHGLLSLKNTKRPGLKELLMQSGIYNKKLTTYDIGFILAPRINAFGRLSHAIEALRLLCTTSADRARGLARLAGNTNQSRQDLVNKAFEEAEQTLKAGKKILIETSKNWEEGIIGLVAAKLSQKYYRPAIAITSLGEVAKASARSIPGFDITKFLRKLDEYMIDMGGHAAAAGFSIKPENIDAFIAKAHKLADREIKSEMLIPTLNIDIEIPLERATLSLAKNIQRCEPFGIGNPQPLLLSKGIIKDFILLGKSDRHIKLLVETKNLPIEMIYFDGAEQLKSVKKNSSLSFAYTLDVNQWNDKEKVQGIIKNLV